MDYSAAPVLDLLYKTAWVFTLVHVFCLELYYKHSSRAVCADNDCSRAAQMMNVYQVGET
jgi:hypothetical protein